MFPKFKKKEDIPAAFVEFYEEKNGEWVVKAPEDVEDVTALKGALKKEREAREALEKEKKDAAKKAKDEKEAADLRAKGLTDEQLTKIRNEVRADLEKEYEPLKTEAVKYKGENRTLRLDNAVKNIMAKKEVGVRAERQETLWRLIGEDFDLTEDGKPMVKASPGTPVEKYLSDAVKKQYPEFYQGTQAAGGGAKGDTSAASVVAGQPAVADILANPAQAMRQAREAGATT